MKNSFTRPNFRPVSTIRNTNGISKTVKQQPDTLAAKSWVTRLAIIPLVSLALGWSAENPGHWISVQGLLSKPNGATLADGPYELCFRLYPMAAGGSAMWNECDQVQVRDGLYQSVLGDSVTLSNLGVQPQWLEVEVAGEVLEGRVPLTGSPRAWAASNVTDSIFEGVGMGKDIAVLSLQGLRNDVRLVGDGQVRITAAGDSVHLALLLGPALDSLSDSMELLVEHQIQISEAKMDSIALRNDSAQNRLNLALQTELDSIAQKLDSTNLGLVKSQLRIDSIPGRLDSIHGRIDSTKQEIGVVQNRVDSLGATRASATTAGLLGAADFARFNAKSDFSQGAADARYLPKSGVDTLRFLPRNRAVAKGEIPLCDASTEGLLLYDGSMYTLSPGRMLVCAYMGLSAPVSFKWVSLMP